MNSEMRATEFIAFSSYKRMSENTAGTNGKLAYPHVFHNSEIHTGDDGLSLNKYDGS